MFAMGSRYYGLPVLQKKNSDGTETSYVSRRFLPSGDEFDLLMLHQVTGSDRLDNITAQYLDDPQQFWRICDANEAVSPIELTATPGTSIRITLPQGIPGPTNG